MAPATALVETITAQTSTLNLKADEDTVNKKKLLTQKELEDIDSKLRGKQFNKTVYGIDVEVDEKSRKLRVSEKEKESAKYPEWLPTWDPTDKYEPYEAFEWEDKGLKADANLKNLFPNGQTKENIKNLTPKFGTEITGIQLSELTDEAKNDLAKYTAERGVLIFRDQDLGSKGPEFAAKYGDYFGPQHIHPTSGAPESTSKIHLIYRPQTINNQDALFLFKNRTNTLTWHSDLSFEAQPPSITFLGLLEGPEAGGDTVFVDTVEAFKRLSPEFQEILKGLKVRHKDSNQPILTSDKVDLSRRGVNTVVHPLIRTITSTGEKALYVSGFSKSIEGFKEEESAFLLKFLNDHLHGSADLQIRAKWEPGTVVVWDNRRTEHSALFDWHSNDRRHLFRITPLGEVPYL